MNIFLTGATGFLGQYLVKLLAQKGHTLYFLTRNKEKNPFIGLDNVIAIQGDITNLEVIKRDEEKREEILESIDLVIHAAALYDLKASHSESFLHNVVGTQNMIGLMNKMKNLKSFYYVSTIAVGDSKNFFLAEDELPTRNKFEDHYSETKYLAEQVVRESADLRKYTTRIIRPGIVVGDSKSGYMPKVDGPYYFIEAYKKYAKMINYLPFAPLSFSPRSKIPLIPVDHCTEAIVSLIENNQDDEKSQTFHLVSDEIPTIQEFLEDLNHAFEVKTKFIPVRENALHSSLLKMIGIPQEVLPFMFSRISYDKTKTIQALPEIKQSKYSKYKHIIFGKQL